MACRIRRVRDRTHAVALFREYVRFHDDEWPVEEILRDLAGAFPEPEGDQQP